MKNPAALDTKRLEKGVREAVAHYWMTREAQGSKQKGAGRLDQGARSAVTGGAQMGGFISLLTGLILEAGEKPENIFHNKKLELPGFFRPTKEWDLLVVRHEQLIIALEAKSQVGPSFGNNFNNRTEEALGSSLDLWTAFREGALNKTIKPWLGYFFLLEDCPKSNTPVKSREPHFPVLPEFRNASYAKRYELFCRKLVREKHYSASAFMKAERLSALAGEHTEPADDLSFVLFVKSMIAQIAIYS
jgi:hypothetical protein